MFRSIALYCLFEIVSLIFVNGLYPTTKSAACVPQTIPTTTTTNSALSCWSGYGFFFDCKWAINTPAELAKCEEENRELAKFAFKVKQCPPGHTECYNSYYACGDGRYSLDHGCALPAYATCKKQDTTIKCLNGKPIVLNCEQCKGKLCNNKNVTYSYGPYSTTTPTTTTTMPPGRIRCLYGGSRVDGKCVWAIKQSQEALAKCVAQEEQKQNFTFEVQTCEGGRYCYDIYYNCRFAQTTQHVIHARGCVDNKYTDEEVFCNIEQATAVCSGEYPNLNICWKCTGDLCNKNNKPYY